MEPIIRESEWIEKKPRPKLPRRYNDPERANMLAERYAAQRARKGSSAMWGVPAWKNRRTGEVHRNLRRTRRWEPVF